MEQDQIRRELDVLALLRHRNRNQHRRSHWWQRVSQLERCVRQVVDGNNQIRNRAIRSAHAIYVLDNSSLVISQLVSDVRFSALALCLLAQMARIRRYLETLLENAPTRAMSNDMPLLDVRAVSVAPSQSLDLDAKDASAVISRSKNRRPTERRMRDKGKSVGKNNIDAMFEDLIRPG